VSRDVISFGPFSLFVAERLLERDGIPVRLGSRALDILIALVECAPDVVSKKELAVRVWPNVIVEEGTLRVHITALRKALDDGRSGARYVANVSGRGYCFVAPISHPASKSESVGNVRHDTVSTDFAPITMLASEAAIINRLSQEAIKIMRSPEMRARLVNESGQPMGNTPQQFQEVIKRAIEELGAIIKEAAIKVE
jgi:DNA-binding winged helix-turn-helix (wHTH) protein